MAPTIRERVLILKQRGRPEKRPLVTTEDAVEFLKNYSDLLHGQNTIADIANDLGHRFGDMTKLLLEEGYILQDEDKLVRIPTRNDEMLQKRREASKNPP